MILIIELQAIIKELSTRNSKSGCGFLMVRDMRETISTNLVSKDSSKLELTSRHHSKKISRFYAKFLELLMRKTEADRRVELFGSDPFK